MKMQKQRDIIAKEDFTIEKIDLKPSLLNSIEYKLQLILSQINLNPCLPRLLVGLLPREQLDQVIEERESRNFCCSVFCNKTIKSKRSSFLDDSNSEEEEINRNMTCSKDCHKAVLSTRQAAYKVIGSLTNVKNLHLLNCLSDFFLDDEKVGAYFKSIKGYTNEALNGKSLDIENTSAHIKSMLSQSKETK